MPSLRFGNTWNSSSGMKTYYHFLAAIIISIFFAHPELMAQSVKNEGETSIKSSEMPASALSLIKQFWKDHKKADFYREFDGEKISYEAKLYRDGYQYSIEFDKNGLLEDVEQLIEFNEIPGVLRNTITEEINQQYTKHRITRVQRQFSTKNRDEEDIIEKVLEGNFDDLTIRYELEIEAQNKEELGTFELLFNHNGQLIQKRKILRRSLDNIW